MRMVYLRLRTTRLAVVEAAGEMLLRSVVKAFMALTGLFLVVEAAGEDILLAIVAALAATAATLFALTECALAMVAAFLAMVFAMRAARAFASAAF
jgi:hypothetical protein